MWPETNNPELFKASSHSEDGSGGRFISSSYRSVTPQHIINFIELAKATFKALSELYFDERANNR